MAYEVIGSIAPDNLIAGQEVPLLKGGVLLASGQGVLKRGSVIGLITASGKGKLCDKNSSDGSQTAKYILGEDVDTTSADKISVCYKTGLFNRKALIYGANGAPTTIDSDFRGIGIFLKDSI